MEDIASSQGRYPEIFKLIPLLEACLEWGSRRGVLGGHLGFLIKDMEERVFLDIMDDGFYPREDTLKVSCSYVY